MVIPQIVDPTQPIAPWTDSERVAVIRQMFAKGAEYASEKKAERSRIQCGEQHPSSTLTDADVRHIRELRRGGLKLQAIGDIYGIHATTVSSITLGKTWKHVDDRVAA